MKMPTAARASPSTSRARWSSTGKGRQAAEIRRLKLGKRPDRERGRARRGRRRAGGRDLVGREPRAEPRAGARLRVGAIPRNFDAEGP